MRAIKNYMKEKYQHNLALDTSYANLQEAEANVESVQAQIKQKTITAPFDGRIGIQSKINLEPICFSLEQTWSPYKHWIRYMFNLICLKNIYRIFISIKHSMSV